MSRLADIIDTAASGDASVPALLRKMMMLASRLQTLPLAGWLDKELGGYSPDDDVPNYRGPFDAEVLSTWSGPGGAITKNLALPPSAVPEGLREAGATG